MARILLILPTGTYRAEEYLRAAERLHVEVVVGSERAQALAARMGEGFVELPLDEPAEAARRIVAQARRAPLVRLDAIIGVDDQGLMAAALAAAELGLPHNSPGAVSLTRDKAAMRAAFLAAGVPQPDFAVVARDGSAAARGAARAAGAGSGVAGVAGVAEAAGGAEAAGVAEAAERLGWPVVMKPCSLSGSRGVIRADSPEEVRAAAERIEGILDAEGEARDAPVLVESFVPGPEVAVEGIVVSGDAEVIAVFDKPDPLDGPFFEETIYLSPTNLPDYLADAVVNATKAAVRALGLIEGPFHAELRVPGALAAGAARVPATGAPVAVLEVAARTIGGRCSKAMVLKDGSSLEELVISNALGAKHPRPSLASPCGILMIPIPASGTLTSVGGVSEVRALPGITGVEITIPIGRPVRALPEGDRYLGFVFASAGSRESVEHALREAERRLVVGIDAAQDVEVGVRIERSPRAGSLDAQDTVS